MAKLLVGYQGEPGAYSEAAAHEAFEAEGRQIETIALSSFEEVFAALAAGRCEYAALPIENTLGGSIHTNYDLLLRYHGQLYILGEHCFRVRHALLALPGVTKGEVKRAMSHPQALAQTDAYLRHAKITPVPQYDTAGSAKMIKEGGLRDCAAVASIRAADVHGLEVLDFGIEDDDNNYTRFLILGRKPCELPMGVPTKTSVVFVPHKNETGALFKALSVFSVRDIDLSKIESRPFRPGSLAGTESTTSSNVEHAGKKQRGEGGAIVTNGSSTTQVGPQFFYAFYVDLLTLSTDEKCQNAIRHLSELASLVRVLGCYPVQKIALNAADSSAAAALTASPSGSLAMPLRVAVVGFGTFGQFLAKRWIQRGHVVYAYSRSDYSETAAAMGAAYFSDAHKLAAEEIDVVVIAVSILSFEKVTSMLPPALLKNRLVVDVLSVKRHAKEVMLRLLPADSDILCLHPMFGPDSGKDSWHGLPCVFDQVRVSNYHRTARCLTLFENEGCRMVNMSCEQHDDLAAGSQFVTHLTGRLLSKLNLQPCSIATKGFNALLQLVNNTCRDSFDLFYALYSHNPYSSDQLSQFSEAFDALRNELTSFEASSSSSSQPIQLSRRVRSMALSKTVAVTDKAAALRREGKQVVSLSVGEPDFNPAPQVMSAAHKALDEGKVKYTENGGMMALREAICDYLKEAKGTPYTPSQIICSNGAKQSLLQSMMALCGPGDEVIIPAPYWVSYTQITGLCGAKSVIINTRADEGFLLQPKALESALTPATRLLILCNPSNPTGAVHPPELLEAIAAVLRKWPRVVIIADEIYEQITFDEKHVAFATLPDMYERTVTINGFSKGPAMTGFRVGYLAASTAIAAACNKVQSQNTSCPCSVSQHAAIAALRDVPESFQVEANAGFKQKRDYVLGRLRSIPGITCETPQGAFYLFPTISSVFGKRTPNGVVVKDSETLCLYLLDECHLALVPGEAFGDGSCLRISYAASMETLKEACDRFERGVALLQ